MLSYTTLPATQWKLMVTTPMAHLLTPLWRSLLLWCGVLLIYSVVLILFTRTRARRVLAPLHCLCEQMEHADLQTPLTPLPSYRTDEIGVLIQPL